MNTRWKWVLCGIGLCIGVQSFAGGDHKEHYAKAVANVSPTGAGKVYVSTENNASGGTYAETSEATADCGGTAANDTKTFYFFSQTNEGYLWEGWYTADNTLAASTESFSASIEAESTSSGRPTTQTWTAKWVQPKVTGVSGGQLGTITDPTTTESLSGTMVFTLSDDKEKGNFSEAYDPVEGFAVRSSSYNGQSHTYTVPVTYTTRGVHGTYTLLYTLTSKFGGSAQTATITATEDYTPDFTMDAYDFGTATTIETQFLVRTPLPSNYAAQHATWTAWIEGEGEAAFAIVGAEADGKAHPADGTCSVTFAPKEARSYSATLYIYAVYTDAAGAEVTSETKSIALSGTGVAPVGATLTVSAAVANPGTYDATGETPLYTFLDQYGTVEKTAGFTIGFANATNITYTWSDNEAGIFSVAEGVLEDAEQAITISAHAATAVTAETTYTATLTVSAQSTVDGSTVEKALQVRVTLYPKHKNTLAFKLTPWSDKSFYYIFTDDKDIYVLQDINNTDTVNYPITISSTGKDAASYFTIDNTTHTLSGIKEMGNSNLTLEQPESPEYEAAKVVLNTFRVRRHNMTLVYPVGSQYLYKNTDYKHIVSTTAEQAGAVTLEVSYNEDGTTTNGAPAMTDGVFRQTLYQNADGTWGMITGDTLSGRRYTNASGAQATQQIQLKVVQQLTDHFYNGTSTPTFYIVKDPIHVPVSPNWNYKVDATTGVVSGIWANNHAYMNGSTYKVEEYQAVWIGNEWVSGKWTGTYSGKTDWTTVAGQGSGNAFALYDGGYVVFHFRGVPFHTSFSMWYKDAASDASGTVTVEESADGITWTPVTPPANVPDDYYSKVSGKPATYQYTVSKSGYLRPTSQYIRYSYSGADHIVIGGSTVSENTYVRTEFASLNTQKEITPADTLVRHELYRNEDGSWGTFDFTIQAANWGESGVVWESSNPDFVVEYDPFETEKGLDHYAERKAKVRYMGSSLYASTRIRLAMRGFYGNLSTDTLRSYVFKVYAVGTGVPMPQTITNETKGNKYLTGTVGPIQNKDRTRTGSTISEPYGDLQMADYGYSQGNISHESGLRKHDFMNCFGTDGLPLFDRLYIFGTTSNSDGRVSTYNTYYTNAKGDTLSLRVTNVPTIANATKDVASNAVTPLYIYDKQDAQYVLTETVDNANRSDQLISIEANNQRIYFSGHCPELSVGYQPKEHGGAIYVSGSAGARIDLYFEDCVIRSRVRTQDGRNIDIQDLEVYGGMSTTYPLGSGSTLVFQCTGSNNSSSHFTPYVHFRGENRLRSASGSPMDYGLKNINQSNSPIQVLISSDKSYTEITLDDVWLLTADGTQTERTNGYLRLNKTGNCPSVDLGNANTIVNFAGGRIDLQNSMTGSSRYANTFAISYREYSGSYGIGPDQDGGTVYFKDGTVSALPLNVTSLKDYYSYEETDAEGNQRTMGLDEIVHGDGTKSYYTTSLRTPKNTYIQGGTHNTAIRAVTEVSGMGSTGTLNAGAAYSPGKTPTDGDPDPQPVARYDVEISSVDDKGFAHFTFPDDMGNPTTGQTLAAYYEEKGWVYGKESMAPDKDGYIHLWLPMDWLGIVEQEVVSVDWIDLLTRITIPGVAGLVDDMQVGGDKSVDITKKNSNLLYCVMDTLLRNLIDNDKFVVWGIHPSTPGEYMSRHVEIGQELYSVVTNEDSYTITDKLYYMMIVNADIWLTFTPPFDVKRMYVFQSYPDDALSEAVESGTLSRYQARQKQAEHNAYFAGFAGARLLEIGKTFADFERDFLTWAYKQDTTNQVYPREANYKTVNGQQVAYYPTTYGAAKGYTTDYRGKQELKPVTGPNDWAGNFYLFRSEDNTWAYEDGKFATDWEFVDPDADDGILMRQGAIYSMRFPYCYGCDDPTTRDYWDYWTGKLIILEGDGPQTIAGTNSHEEQFVPYVTPNSASLRGNATFADMQVPNYEGAEGYLSNAYFHRDGQSQFEPANDQATGTLAPGKVFLLANTPATPAGAPARSVASIDVETGVITYEEGDGSENEQTGVPTVSGGRTLLATIEEGALTLIPVVEQDVALYTSAGQLVFAGHLAAEQTFPLPTGIYLVRGEKEQIKVVIR